MTPGQSWGLFCGLLAVASAVAGDRTAMLEFAIGGGVVLLLDTWFGGHK